MPEADRILGPVGTGRHDLVDVRGGGAVLPAGGGTVLETSVGDKVGAGEGHAGDADVFVEHVHILMHFLGVHEHVPGRSAVDHVFSNRQDAGHVIPSVQFIRGNFMRMPNIMRGTDPLRGFIRQPHLLAPIFFARVGPLAFDDAPVPWLLNAEAGAKLVPLPRHQTVRIEVLPQRLLAAPIGKLDGTAAPLRRGQVHHLEPALVPRPPPRGSVGEIAVADEVPVAHVKVHRHQGSVVQHHIVVIVLLLEIQKGLLGHAPNTVHLVHPVEEVEFSERVGIAGEAEVSAAGGGNVLLGSLVAVVVVVNAAAGAFDGGGVGVGVAEDGLAVFFELVVDVELVEFGIILVEASRVQVLSKT
mmetsp:Transcript_50009/g.97889  ORF Transcript_50009/g.97889 Transcript_50009/m.97889 type:complete len:357 (+) Transcript_50009:1456-2526(+)